MAKEQRFIKVFSENIGFTSDVSIYVDVQTGVHYLLVQNGTGAGLTPLLDEHGAPVIDKGACASKGTWKTMDD